MTRFYFTVNLDNQRGLILTYWYTTNYPNGFIGMCKYVNECTYRWEKQSSKENMLLEYKAGI